MQQTKTKNTKMLKKELKRWLIEHFYCLLTPSNEHFACFKEKERIYTKKRYIHSRLECVTSRGSNKNQSLFIKLYTN